MNFKLGFIIFIVGFAFITSCKKENIDTTNVEEEVVIDTVTCNLSIDIIENDSTGVLTAFVAGGTTPYNFEWSTEETTESITVSSDGIYEVTVTDSLGCVYSNSITVGVDLCNSLAVSLAFYGTTLAPYVSGGTAPYTYQWSTGETTDTITYSFDVTHEVTVTDSQGCVYTTSITIDESDLCIFFVGIIDFGPTLTASASGGTAPYTYQWSTGETTESIIVSSGGTYEVTAMDSMGCTYSASITIEETDVCNLSYVSIRVDPYVSGTKLRADVYGGIAPFVYQWSTGETTECIPISEGTYEVTVIDSLNCVYSSSITVDQSVLCNSLSIYMEVSGMTLTAYASGGTAPYTYQWSTGETSESIIYLYDVAYEVTITDGAGCTVSDSITIDEPDPCQSLNVFLVSDSLTNILTVSPVGGIPPYAYEWSTGNTTESITVFYSGTYQVTVTDNEGCESINSFTAMGVPCNGLNISFDFDAAASTLTADVNGGTIPYWYEWSTGETTKTISVVSGDTYALAVVDAGGCVGEDAYTVP